MVHVAVNKYDFEKKNQHFRVRFCGGGGGHQKAYAVYAYINVDNRPFPPTFAIQREREKLRYWVGFFGVLSSPLKTAFGTIENCRLRSH